MAAKIRLSKAAREKLKKEEELYEQTCFFIMHFRPTKVLDLAFKNTHTVLKDLEAILTPSSSFSSSSPFVDDASSIIIKNRSTIENELVYICDNSSDINTQQAFKEFLVHFKQGDLSKYGAMVSDPYDLLFSNCEQDTKEKAPQLTQLERKQQKEAQQKHQICLLKLQKESRLYSATLRFMVPFLNASEGIHIILPYSSIMRVNHELRSYIDSHEVLCDKDVSLVLDGYRSKVENELQCVCDTVSDHTVREAFTRYLDDFKTGLKLSQQDYRSHLQNEDSKIMSSKPKRSVKKKKKKSKLRLRRKGGSTSCKSPSLFGIDTNGYFLDNHNKCCMKNNLEISDSEWEDPNILMALVKQEYPNQELLI